MCSYSETYESLTSSGTSRMCGIESRPARMEISAERLSNESRKKLFQSPLPQNGISGFVAWSTGTVPLCSDRGASSAAASSSEPCGACRGVDATTIVLEREREYLSGHGRQTNPAGEG